MKNALRLVTLLSLFSVNLVLAKDHKDCWMYMVSNLQNGNPPAGAPVIAYRDEDKWKHKLKDHLTKDQCLDNDKAKKEGCDHMMAKCGENKQSPAGPVGLVGAWIQWGTSRENCPKTCPGFEKVSPVSYAH